MKKNIKITGIKKAIGEYKRWISEDYRRTGNFMLNVITGEVWVDCFVDVNSWKEYNDENIISLSSYIIKNMEKQLTMLTLKKYAEMAITQKNL